MKTTGPKIANLPLNKPFIHLCPLPDKFAQGKGWKYRIDAREVTLIGISGSHAWVKRKGCIPYTCPKKELSPHNA